MRLGLGATWRLQLGPRPPYLPLPCGPGTAMDGQLLLVLLLLLLGASGPWGQGPGPEGPSEELLKEEFPEEEVTEEENGILVLSRRTLARALQEHPALLVEFCECSGPAGLGIQSPTPCTWGLPLRSLGPPCAPGDPSEGT